MLAHFADLFAYDAWANARALDSIEPLGPEGDKARTLMAHLAAAKFNWLDRIHGRQPGTPFFPAWSVAESRAKHAEAEAAWKSFMAGLTDADVSRAIVYRNLAGVEARRTYGQIMTQLSLHGPHHRGQVASIVRAAGLEPAKTDYILYVG